MAGRAGRHGAAGAGRLWQEGGRRQRARGTGPRGLHHPGRLRAQGPGARAGGGRSGGRCRGQVQLCRHAGRRRAAERGRALRCPAATQWRLPDPGAGQQAAGAREALLLAHRAGREGRQAQGPGLGRPAPGLGRDRPGRVHWQAALCDDLGQRLQHRHERAVRGGLRVGRQERGPERRRRQARAHQGLPVWPEAHRRQLGLAGRGLHQGACRAGRDGELRGRHPARQRAPAARRPAHTGLSARRHDLGRLPADAAARGPPGRLHQARRGAEGPGLPGPGASGRLPAAGQPRSQTGRSPATGRGGRAGLPEPPRCHRRGARRLPGAVAQAGHVHLRARHLRLDARRWPHRCDARGAEGAGRRRRQLRHRPLCRLPAARARRADRLRRQGRAAAVGAL
mmetsp:Transcript_20818/g.79834  ORF Transcript_20818/g.79834 Transcript_20818/m.79834 type:complete len:396 (+) Transcript_20818:5097-6284(+)